MPSLALASGQPSNPGQSQQSHGSGAPKVMYVLRGTLGGYTAATSTGDGTITIKVAGANRHGQALKALNGDTLSFTLSSSTRIVLRNGAAIADGDNGIAKVRGPKSTAAFAAATDLNFQIVDQGRPQQQAS